MTAERVQKILARAGFGSRRACEKLIEAGRVRVNGQPARLGAKADVNDDRITVDGKPISLQEHIYIMLNKPRGVVTSRNPQGNRRTVLDLVPLQSRLYPVGRLDIESEGLILLTNDGDVANRLTHPRYGHEKEYLVLVVGEMDEKQLSAWRRGVVLDGKWTAPAKVIVKNKVKEGTWLRVIMREGRKHQIRRTAQSLGLWVKQLQRVRFGNLRLGNLKPGKWRPLSQAEIESLKAYASRSPKQRS